MGAMPQALGAIITLTFFAGASFSQDPSLTPSPVPPPVPVVVPTPNLVMQRNSSLVLLECRLDHASSDSLVRSWLHNDTETRGNWRPGNYMNHTVHNIHGAGAYTCVFKSASAYLNATILVKAAPQFEAVPHSRDMGKKDRKKDHKKERKMSAYIGHRAVITCNLGFQGFPAPTWAWFKLSADERTLTPLTADNSERASGVKAQRVIAAVEREDEGHYMCVASNDAGSTNDTIVFKVHDLRDAVWPFLGIAAEVVVLIVIIFACEKMGRKKETDTPNGNDGTTALKGAAENNHPSSEVLRQRNSK